MPQGGGATSGHRSDTEESKSDQLFRSIREGTSWSGNEQNVLFLNRGDGTFSDVSHATGFDFPDDGRAMAPMDWDHDGDLDVIISNRNAPQIRFLRNDVPHNDYHWLSIRLQGSTPINRDAIGARVAVFLAGQPFIVRSVRAGEGFHTQNTKWLHFGLGSEDDIQKVVVTWPNGEQQTHTQINSNSRYILTYKNPKATASPPLKVNWPASLPPLPSLADEVEGRTLTGSRLPLVPLPHTGFNGQSHLFQGNQPNTLTLVNFWGSWCPPCLQELTEFSNSAEILQKAQIEVLALAVDELSGQQGSKKEAQAFINNLNKNLRKGFATQESLNKVKIIHDLLFEKRGQLALPTSLLIDAQGQIAGYFEGPLTVDEILRLKEIATLERSVDSLTRSLPFSGRWLAAPVEFKLTEYGDALLEEGFLQDATSLYTTNADRYHLSPNLHLHLAKIGLQHEQNGDYGVALNLLEIATSLQPDNAVAAMSMGDRFHQYERFWKAKKNYRSALSLDPTLIRARFNLGVVLMKEENFDEAISTFKECLKVNADYLDAHIHLAGIYLQRKNYPNAVSHLERTVKLKPDYHSARFQLGRLYEAEKRFTEAKATYLKLIEQIPDHTEALIRLKELSKLPAVKSSRD